MHTIMSWMFDPKYRRWQMAGVIAALAFHGITHYLTYIPAARSLVGSLPYFRLHVLHEAEFLLIVVYAALALRWRFGLVALVITGLTSIPFIFAPYIFGRAPRVDELRDLSIQVAFILLMGALIVLFIEDAGRKGDRVTAHARRLTALADLSRAGAASLETQKVVGQALAVVRATVRATDAIVYGYVPSTHSLTCFGQAGIDADRLSKANMFRLTNPDADIPQVLQVTAPEYLPPALAQTRHLFTPETVALVLIPLTAQNERIGLQIVGLRHRAVDPYDLDFLQSAADQLALIVRNTQLYADEHRARTDAEGLVKALRAARGSQGLRPAA